MHTNLAVESPPRFGKHGRRGGGACTGAGGSARPFGCAVQRRARGKGDRGRARALDGDGSVPPSSELDHALSSSLPRSSARWSLGRSVAETEESVGVLLLPTAATPPSFFVVLSFFRRSKCAPAPTRTPPTPPGPTGSTVQAATHQRYRHSNLGDPASHSSAGRRRPWEEGKEEGGKERERERSVGRPTGLGIDPTEAAGDHAAAATARGGRGRCAASVSRFLLRASWWPRWRLSTTSSPPPPTIVAPLHGGGGLQVVPRPDGVPRGIREPSRASEGRRRDAAAIFNCSASCMLLPVSRVSERETE